MTDTSQTVRSRPQELVHFLRGEALTRLHKLLPAYLQQQRWFASKSREIQSVEISSLTPFPDSSFAIAILKVAYAAGSEEVYQLPLGIASASDAEQIRAAYPKSIVMPLHDDHSVLYDASVNTGFHRSLAELFSVPSHELATSHSPALLPESLLGIKTHVGSAEQSNTSIFLGDTAILKLLRRLEPGVNPEVEMTRFLTDVAHFKHIPAYLGEIHLSASADTLAVLQTFAPNDGDGWAWFEKQLETFFSTTPMTSPPAFVNATISLASAVQDSSAHTFADLLPRAMPTLKAAQLLGLRTAEMHRALATQTDDPAFAAETVTAASLPSEEQRIRTQVERGLDALQKNLSSVPQASRSKADQLLSRRKTLLARCQFAQSLQGDQLGKRIRIHGDYHLGQTLRTEDDFLIVDFEGEPAQSLEYRRRKQSPLKDVAGMLRSFSYASASARNAYISTHSSASPNAQQWSDAWTRSISHAYLSAYLGALQHHTGLIPSLQDADTWLTALLLEKSSYELLYELNSRPAWIDIPLDGMLALTS